MEEPTFLTLAGMIVGICVFTTSLFLLMRHMAGGKYSGDDRLDGRTVVITGANTGLGKATAQELARRGGHVIMACRDLAKARVARDEIISQTTAGIIDIIQLDLASFESIRQFSEVVNSRYNNIDILINNAGLFSSSRKQTSDGLEMTIGVCHFGHFMLTNLLLNKIKVSKQGRIVYLSSLLHCKGRIDFDDINFEHQNYSCMEAYQQAKLANVLCTRELANRLRGTNVTVNCLHPGAIVTDIGRDIPYKKLLQVIMFPIIMVCFKNEWQGIQTTLRLALDPSLSGVTGKYFSDCVEKTPSPRALDDASARKLWVLSEDVTQTTA